MKSRVDHVAIAVRDPERAAAIFCELFGAAIIEPDPQHRGPPELTLRMPGLDLVLVSGAGPILAGAGHIAFRVSAAELARMRAQLDKLGLRHEPPRHGPPDRGRYFIDFDNNLFELCVRD